MELWVLIGITECECAVYYKWNEDRVTPTPNIQIYLVFKETRVSISNVSVEIARRVACQSRR